ncbi:translocation protein TolB [Fulvivirga sp. RKSG066]|uniref:PD40 domain-containing protein n=1 Tax=Fulvivirga aurantia TaxID=2529383 RepID=UPI0012BC0062|nr:PD40 domain-containing protein [Fulvivirga aurantia]MTI21604.1 translocation protein TolB [Fulvivirga aurantia]
MIKYFYSTFVIVALLISFAGQAQIQEEFGRNRVQYEEFEWRFLSSENFDVYFYQGGDRIAKEVIEYLEEEFDRITDLIGYPPYSKTKLFLYNSVSDLQQSNVGLDQAGIGPGGETQFIKPYIEVAHPGSISALKDELIIKVSTLMVNEMMFGGSLKDMFQSSVLLNLPEWFISGAARYVAEGWSIEMDDYIRDYITTRKPERLSRLTGEEAALAGQSVWNYIAEQYGRSNISNILNYTRIIRNEEKSVTITLGVPFEQIMYNWQAYYVNVDSRVNQDYLSLNPEYKVVHRKNKKRKTYSHVAVNNSGSKLAYTENNAGRYAVIVKDIDSKEEKTILKGGYKVVSQDVNFDLPLIDWVDSATLGIIHSKQGKLWFDLYDLNTNSKLPRQLTRFEQVQSMSFSDNGRLLIISGMVYGKTDLYLLSTRRDRVKRLFDDVYDDIDASFVPNTNTIVFSSNRPTDTLNLDDKSFEKVGSNHNLFFFNLDTTKNLLRRVTNTISKDTRPLAYNGNTIYYLSDQKGIKNIFKYDVSTEIYSQVTNYSSSVDNWDIDFDSRHLALAMSERGRDYVYSVPNFDIEQEIFTPITPRQQVIQAREFKARRTATVDETLTIQDIVESRLKEKEQELNAERLDTANVKVDTVINEEISLISDSLQLTDMDTVAVEPVEEPEVVEEDNEIIDTDDYTFETDVLEETRGTKDSFLAQYRKLRQKNSITGPYPYEPRFSAKNLVTSFLIDPLRGFGIFLETEMYDMLENHMFRGGALATNLRSGDIFAEYYYLKSRVDYKARFERSVILREENTERQYSRNTIQIGAALPFNNRARFEVNPFFTMTRFENLTPTSISPPQFSEGVSTKYVGTSAALVYDNSLINGMNIIEGSRGKIEFTHHEGLDDKDASFSKLTVDLRHYQKIHREIVFATRLYYGSFFGRDPKQFLLGGMDNWLFKQENTRGDNNPLSPDNERPNDDLLFIEYATNLRGFDYATIVGRNTLLFNAELRIPIIRYLASGPISSNFLRNLQFTGFFDIGSAWTGKSPFNEENTISTETIREGSFVIDIKNFQNPWLYSYGAGLRTMLLGYYVKFDLAWPVEDFNTQDPRLMVTLGYDF